MGKQTSSDAKLSLETIAAVVLGVLAIAALAFQAYSFSSQTTQRETVLFNALQFFLTVGFAWFSTRAVSRHEFESSLKRYALTAYRGVADIQRMLEHLSSRLDDMTARRDDEETSELDLVKAVVTDTCHVVRSSMADWADLLGPELQALEEVRRLEQQRDAVEAPTAPAASPDNTTETVARIQDLDRRIDEVLKRLPAPLQAERRQEQQQKESARELASRLASLYHSAGGTFLDVRAGGQYSTKDPTGLTPGQKLRTTPARSGLGLDVVDQTGAVVGRVLNRALGTTYRIFADALVACFGTAEIPVEFVGIETTFAGRTGVRLFGYRVRVGIAPVIDVAKQRGRPA